MRQRSDSAADFHRFVEQRVGRFGVYVADEGDVLELELIDTALDQGPVMPAGAPISTAGSIG